MNFKFKFLSRYPKDIESFEDITENSALIEYSKIDLPSTTSLITSFNTKNIAYLQVMDLIDLCYIVPKHDIPNYLMTQFEMFDINSFILLIVSIVLLIVVWSLIEIIRWKAGEQHVSIQDILLVIVQAQNLQPIHNFSKYKHPGVLILVGLFFFIICNTYQGIIACHLVHQNEMTGIDSLESVDRSKLNVLSTVTNVFNPTPDDIRTNSIIYRLSKIPTKFVHIKTFHLQYNSTIRVAILTPTGNANYIITILFDRKTGRDLYRIVGEKLCRHYRSFMIPKNSPYRERFNEILIRLIETGFVQCEYGDLAKITYGKYIARSRAGFGEKPRKVVIKMEHLDQLIILWIGMMSGSTIAFFLELCFYNIPKRAHSTLYNWCYHMCKNIHNRCRP